MVISKNNRQLNNQNSSLQKNRFGIRKLSVGVASVVLGTTVVGVKNVAADSVGQSTSHPTATATTTSNYLQDNAVTLANANSTSRIVKSYKTQEWLNINYPANTNYKNSTKKLENGSTVNLMQDADGTQHWEPVKQSFTAKPLNSLALPEIQGYHPVVTRVTIGRGDSSATLRDKSIELLNRIAAQLPNSDEIPAVTYDFPGQINFYVKYVKDQTPVEPEQPTIPDQPNVPEQPVIPDAPSTPGQQVPELELNQAQDKKQTNAHNDVVNSNQLTTSNRQQKLPQTGNQKTPASLIGLSMMSITALLGIGISTKRHYN